MPILGSAKISGPFIWPLTKRLFLPGCHCWLVQQCMFRRHCWTSQQWHPSKLTRLLGRNSTHERPCNGTGATEYLVDRFTNALTWSSATALGRGGSETRAVQRISRRSTPHLAWWLGRKVSVNRSTRSAPRALSVCRTSRTAAPQVSTVSQRAARSSSSADPSMSP